MGVARKQNVRPVELAQDVFAVIDVARDDAGDVLLDAPAEAIVAVSLPYRRPGLRHRAHRLHRRRRPRLRL